MDSVIWLCHSVCLLLDALVYVDMEQSVRLVVTVKWADLPSLLKLVYATLI